MMDRQPHILNASSNLLGISLLIVTGINISDTASRTLADEVAWGASLLFMLSITAAYLAIRHPESPGFWELWADRIFMLGLVTLFAAVAVLATGDLRLV